LLELRQAPRASASTRDRRYLTAYPANFAA
jgi:hypothetical protein